MSILRLIGVENSSGAHLNKNHIELSNISLFSHEGLFIRRDLDNDIAYKVSNSWRTIELIIVLLN
jgi:hypothetical protein